MNRSIQMVLGLLVAVVLLAACGQGGTTGGGAATQVPQATAAAEQPTAMAEQPTAMAEKATSAAEQPTAAAAQPTSATSGGGGLLDEVKKRGKLIISTDANYKPQSFKNPDGSFEGFDVDVGREIAKRLGVDV